MFCYSLVSYNGSGCETVSFPYRKDRGTHNFYNPLGRCLLLIKVISMRTDTLCFMLTVPRHYPLLPFCDVIIGIKHGVSCINNRQVPWEVLKTAAFGGGFQHFLRDLANVNA